MVSTVMLAACRTILDETTASFWTDAQVYAALADGQNEVIKEVLAVYKARYKLDPDTELPSELTSVGAYASGAITSSVEMIAVPAGFLWLVNAKWDHDNAGALVPCRIMTMDRGLFHYQGNTFLAATATDPIAYVGAEIAAGGHSINFLPDSTGTANYAMYFIQSPTDIAAGQNATYP